MEKILELCQAHMAQVCHDNPDPSHDLLHVQRVVRIARELALQESAKLEVVLPAAYLHDCVYISKMDARRSQASRISADYAMELLRSWGYPETLLPQIHHAILSHSFSANVPAETLEAKIVQDADRLDAIGAIGTFRALAFSGMARRSFYSSDDPFCRHRSPNDERFTLDHFFVKLLRLEERLHTSAAKREAAKRMQSMRAFLNSLNEELSLGSEAIPL